MLQGERRKREKVQVFPLTLLSWWEVSLEPGRLLDIGVWE